MGEIKDKGFLSSYVIYSLPVLFLMPMQPTKTQWWPFPGTGPVYLAFLAALFLLLLYLYENLSDGKKMNITLEHKVFIFWLLHVFASVALVIVGVRSSLDQVGTRLYSGIAPYFLDFMVFLVIRNNGWKIHDYERVIKVFLLVSLVWAIESFVAFYLRTPIPGLNSVGSAVFAGEYITVDGFISGFTGSLHIVSKVSLVAVWLCIYMYLRYGLTRYIFLGTFNFLTIASTLNRASLAACILFLLVFVFLVFVKFRGKRTTRKITVSAFTKGALLTMLMFTLIGIGQFTINFKNQAPAILLGIDFTEVEGTSSLLQDSPAYLERLYQYARAIEVIVQYPLGAGAGLGYLMCYSQDTKQIFTDELRQVEPFLLMSKYYQSGMFGADLQQRKVGHLYTIHNATLNWLMDYGVFSLLLLVGYFYWLVRYYKFCTFLMRKKYNNLGRICLSLLFCQLSVFLAMQATYKFSSSWVLVFLFLFSLSIYRGFENEQRKQLLIK